MILYEKYLNKEHFNIDTDFSGNRGVPKIDIRENRDGIVLNKDTNDEYYIDKPFIDFRFNLVTINISSLSFIRNVPGTTDIEGIVIIDGQPKKWAAGWSDTTLDIANANTLAEIETNISALFNTVEKSFNIRIYLTGTATVTPELTLIKFVTPDLLSTISQLRSNVHEVVDHVYSDPLVYSAIAEADKTVRIDLETYIDFDNLTVITTRIVNKFSQLKSAIIVLQRLFKTPKDTKERNQLTYMMDIYDKLLKKIMNGEIELTAGSVTVDTTRQGKAFGFGSEGQRLEFDSKQDEDEFLIDYDWLNDG